MEEILCTVAAMNGCYSPDSSRLEFLWILVSGVCGSTHAFLPGDAGRCV